MFSYSNVSTPRTVKQTPGDHSDCDTLDRMTGCNQGSWALSFLTMAESNLLVITLYFMAVDCFCNALKSTNDYLTIISKECYRNFQVHCLRLLPILRGSYFRVPM